MERAEFLRTQTPHLVADVTLYDAEQGGRRTPIFPGFGCPCQVSKDEAAWDGWPLLGDQPMYPGETRRLGFFLLSGDEAADALRRTGRFYLWEGGFIGEARVVS